MSRHLPPLAAVASGLLLFTCFAPFSWHEAAWVALVPLALAVRGVSLRRAFDLGWVSGFVFWVLSIEWLRHVTYPGWLTLAAYCALYVGLFAVLLRLLAVHLETGTWPRNLLYIVLGAVGWAGLETLRGFLFTGFAWNPLAASQVRNLPILQLASWGGSAAVSVLVVVMNLAIAVTVDAYLRRKGRPLARAHVELMLAMVVVAFVFASGFRSMRRHVPRGTPLTVGVIQPSIPQHQKWDIRLVRTIYERLHELTALAVSSEQLDLVVWPETALPDDMLHSRASFRLVSDLLTNGVPILVGSMDTEWSDTGPPLHYNSSFLMHPDWGVLERYDKRHLVIFGEYVPLDEHLPFIHALTPIEASFTGGKTSTVFTLPGHEVAFASLICFEDTVAHLAAESVRNGARLLINQTNDAWFDPSAASRQHMAHSVLRCVENRVPGIRAGNTGISCFIDAHGRVYDILGDEDGDTSVPGFRVSTVNVEGPTFTFSPYTRRGNVVGVYSAWAALFMLLGGAGQAWLERLRKRVRADGP